MAIAGQFQTDFSSNRRHAVRRPLRLATTVGASSADAMIHDLSTTGMLLETAEEVFVDDLLLVEIANFGHVAATVVWNSGRFFGCEFEEPLSAAAVSGALLRSPFLHPHSAVPAADNELCIERLCAKVEEAGGDKLPLPTRLVLMLLIAVAAGAPVAVIAALLV